MRGRDGRLARSVINNLETSTRRKGKFALALTEGREWNSLPIDPKVVVVDSLSECLRDPVEFSLLVVGEDNALGDNPSIGNSWLILMSRKQGEVLYLSRALLLSRVYHPALRPPSWNRKR